jgi:hypothetical protein
MFCAPRLVFGGTEGIGSHFHVLRSQARFWRYRGRRVLISCFALPDSFSAVPRESVPVFMFYTPGLIFGVTKGVGSRFHILRSRTPFRRYRGRRITFSYFAHPYSFSTVPTTEGVGSHFHVLRSRTHFQRCRVRRVPFLCFARSDSFSAVPRASDPVFMFSATGHVFGGAEDVGFRFHVLRSRHVFGGTEGVGSRFHVLYTQTCFRRNRGRRLLFSCFAFPDSLSAVRRVPGPVFMFCAPGLVFGGTEGIGSRFHILRSQARFRRYDRRRVSILCFALPDSFLAVPRASGPVFMFCAS